MSYTKIKNTKKKHPTLNDSEQKKREIGVNCVLYYHPNRI